MRMTDRLPGAALRPLPCPATRVEDRRMSLVRELRRQSVMDSVRLAIIII